MSARPDEGHFLVTAATSSTFLHTVLQSSADSSSTFHLFYTSESCWSPTLLPMSQAGSVLSLLGCPRQQVCLPVYACLSVCVSACLSTCVLSACLVCCLFASPLVLLESVFLCVLLLSVSEQVSLSLSLFKEKIDG